MADPRVLGIVLAGGAGTRLAPLTDDRAKPAVPFGGVYRLVDFALSNLANSSIRKICVLTQYKSHSLDRHISVTWRMSDLLGNYVTPVPAQQRRGAHWYSGSADAIFQSMNLINDEKPDIVVVVGADHVYRMDPRQMIAQHLEHGAGVTVAAIPVARQDAKAFGIVGVGANGRTIEKFVEKPANPPTIPDSPEESFASMGIYVFDTKALVDVLHADAADTRRGTTSAETSSRRWWPTARRRRMTSSPTTCPARRNGTPATGATSGPSTPTSTRTWTCAPSTPCSTSTTTAGRSSPTWTRCRPPSSCTTTATGSAGRSTRWCPTASSSPAAWWAQSVLSPGVRVNSWSTVERSVLLHNVIVGRHAEIRDAIIDKNVVVPEGAKVGVDKEHDLARGFVVSPGGITVVGKGQDVTL